MGRVRRVATGVLVVSLACILGPVSAAFADSSTGFQVDTARTGAQPGGPAPPLRRAWEAHLPAPQTATQFSYPVIAGGTVFVTGTRWDAPSSLYALDLDTGAVRWGPKDIGGDGHWSGLTYDAGVLYTVARDGTVTAVDPATGQTLWTTALGGSVAAEPVAANGQLYVAPGAGLAALSTVDGRVLWRRAFGWGSRLTPAIWNGTLFINESAQNAAAFTPSGTLLWHHSGPLVGGGGRAVAVYRGRVYVRDDASSDGVGVVLDATTGSEVGRFQATEAPAFSGNTGFFVNSGTLTATNLNNGQAQWTFADHSLMTPPVVAGGVVYVGSEFGELYALAPTTGQVVWRTNVGGRFIRPDEHGEGAPLTGFAAAQGYLVFPVQPLECGHNVELVAYAVDPGGPVSANVPNDDLNAAQPVTKRDCRLGGSNVGATNEPGEPTHSGVAGGASVWYRFTAPADGTLAVGVRSSSLQTVLAVYEGSSYGSLVKLADDAHGPERDAYLRITLPVIRGTTYSIALDGQAGAPTGSFEIGFDYRAAPPSPVIAEPASSEPWSVGQTISFAGAATDNEGTAIPASGLQWTLIRHDCLDGTCTNETVRSWDGVASGSFAAPDAEGDSVSLVLFLTATDSGGLSAVTSVRLTPRTVVMSFGSYAVAGFDVEVDGVRKQTPYHRYAVIGSTHTVAVPGQRDSYDFVSWDDGGAPTHTITAPSFNKSWFATFNAPPQPAIASPDASVTWSVGQAISFTGSASDREDGTLAASALRWDLVLHSDSPACSGGIVDSRSGIASGSFVAPDTPCPGHLELRLTAVDSRGSATTTSVRLDPVMVVISFGSYPQPGRDVIVDGVAATTAYHRWAVVGSSHTISAPSRSGAYDFAGWDDGGAQTHTIVAPSFNKSWFANWAPHNEAPQPSIEAAATHWAVGDTISFSGSASDPEDGALGAAGLSWELLRIDCNAGPCTTESLGTWNSVSSGAFVAPDSPQLVYLILRLTATDSRGAQAVTTVQLDPATVVISFGSYPDAGIAVVFDGVAAPTPHHHEVVVGSTHTISAPSTDAYVFAGWDDGGAQTHTITAPAFNKSWFASYTKVG